MTPFIAQIQPVGFNFAPRGWALCDHQLLSISAYSAVFSLVGTTFGGDGRTTFGVPGLRGRSPVHVGNGAGLSSINWGQVGGNENTTLTTANLPSHNHTGDLHGFRGTGTSNNPSGNALSGPDDGSKIYQPETPNKTMVSGSVTTNNTGSSTQFSNRPPYLGIYYCFALTGVFPSRN